DSERRFRSFQVSHFAYQHDVRVLAQGGPQRASKGMSVRVNLALVHNAPLVAMQVLYRVLDRDDVFVPLAIDFVEHRRQRRRFARPRRSRHEDKPVRFLAEAVDDLRQTQLVKGANFVGDCPEYCTDGAALVEYVGPESRETFDPE